MQFAQKDILDISSLSQEEIRQILETAEGMKEISTRSIKKVPTLRGKTVILFFYEPSTRTRTSFDIAAKRLSADTHAISASTSSIVKGETLIDTARNLQAMQPDVIVLRHSSSGAPHLMARMVDASVINAGDGMHEHPTQALQDMMTVKEHRGEISGLRVAIIGDIAHSRVARSNMLGFRKMGADVIVSGPPTLLPVGIEEYGVSVTCRIEEAIEGADVIMMLRIQKERLESFLFPTEREYSIHYGLNNRRLNSAKEGVLIMHPGPINRGVEIAPEVADGPHSLILEQVTNGVAVRMALLYLVMGGVRDGDSD